MDRLNMSWESDQSKQAIRSKTLSSIIEWSQRRGELSTMGMKIPDKHFNPIVISKAFTSRPEEFRSLVMSMLRFCPDERPVISDIVKHEYFTHMEKVPYTIVSSPVKSMTPNEIRSIDNLISRYTNCPDVIAKCKELYARCHKFRDDDRYMKILACFWLSHKLNTGVPPDNTDIPIHKVVEMERQICHFLNFRLHVPSSNGAIVM
jgi:serine/threonine protein kinase